MTNNNRSNKIKLPLSLQLLRMFEFPRKLGICERLYARTLSGYGVCYVECANGLEWKLDLSDVGHRWMLYGYYEGGIGIKYAASKLKDGGVYVDSGANIGQWLMYLSDNPKVQTYAFEPVPEERTWLANCLQNYSNWKVEVISLALGRVRDTLEIQCFGSRSTFHMDWYQGKNHKIIKVNVDRLDSVLVSKGVEEISFWKLDVEGFEYEALLGAEGYLKDQKIGSIHFECHPLNFEKIKEYLAKFGYSIFRISKHGLSDIGPNCPSKTKNFVAEPR